MVKFLRQYEILFKKALVDLNSAKVIFVSFEKGEIALDLEIIFFHLQQSTEKLIKTLLDFNQIKFPHTHDIEDLILLCKTNNINLIASINECILLSEYAVEGRYAIIHDDLCDVDKYIKILDDLLIFVQKTIK